MQCSQRAFVETSARLCARFRLRDRKRVSAWEMMKILGKALLMTVQWTLTPIPSAGFGAGATTVRGWKDHRSPSANRECELTRRKSQQQAGGESTI